MSAKENYQEEVVEGLEESDYLRQRLNPQPGDPLYLHLSDLKIALETIIPSVKGRLLDYGCGGSPYRALFGDCEYQRADFRGIPNLDFEYGEDSALPVPDASYDFVISTQVLEHVRLPGRYLKEAFRILKPRGKLILTTHGFFEEHGAPYDYHRWTAEGLSEELRAAGFEVERVLKLSTGPRALLFLWRRFQHSIVTRASHPVCWFLSAAKWLLRMRPAAVDRFCDGQFQNNRNVEGSDSGHSLYIALFIVARRPG